MAGFSAICCELAAVKFMLTLLNFHQCLLIIIITFPKDAAEAELLIFTSLLQDLFTFESIR